MDFSSFVQVFSVTLGKSNEGFSEGGFSNNRFVLKPDVAIASEVSILSKNSLAITDFHAKKTQHVQLFEKPLPGTPPFATPNNLVPKSPQNVENMDGACVQNTRFNRTWQSAGKPLRLRGPNP